jgi:hypothetical protein
MFLSICGCCGEVTESGPVTIRCFACADGSMNWEHRNFMVSGRSPDDTLWGWGVRPVTSPRYGRRTIHEINLVSSGTQPASASWPQKTNPSGWTTGVAHIAIDLMKVSSGGGKSTLVSGWLEYTGAASTNPNNLFYSDPWPVGFATDTTNLYHCNNDGWFILQNATGQPPEMISGSTVNYARVIIEDGLINGDFLRFTIPSQVILKHTSAGTNVPKWVFRRASTNVSFDLYAGASAIQTALASLPGVAAVTVTGGPCCAADVHVEVEWTNPTFTFTDVWVTYSQGHATSRFGIWNFSTGAVAAVTSNVPRTFTSDSIGIIRDTGIITRYEIAAPTSAHPWSTYGSVEWSVDPFTGYTQTNERQKTTFAATTWDVVSSQQGMADIRNGRILMFKTRSRVPVVEPSTAAMTTNAIIDEATGSISSRHDSYLNAPYKGWLTESGELAVRGAEYEYDYQGGIDGIFPPSGYPSGTTGASGGRNKNGRQFATGNTDAELFEPFSLEAPSVVAATDAYMVSIAPKKNDSHFNWNLTVTGDRSSLEMRLAGSPLAGQWQDFAAGTPFPVLPAHQREYWYCFSADTWPKVPPDCEFRFAHHQGGVNWKETAWMPFDATIAEVDAELQLWYGEPIAGYPTIYLNGTITEHEWQTQPFWRYLPLGAIEIWNDATGSVFAPRGRLLRLELRNGTAYTKRSLVVANRTDGVILWQKDVGLADPVYTSGETVEGEVHYATDAQVVVSTLCLPVLQDDVVLGDCLWEWDGTDWTLLTDNCSAISEAVPPADPGTTPGEQQAGTCELI